MKCTHKKGQPSLLRNTTSQMSKEVTVTFQGELGVELSVDRASGAVRIKRAEADSPAKPHEGATLRSINGKPVGRIETKAAWITLVERLKAPARPLVLTLALAVPEDPVQRVRAELDALAASSSISSAATSSSTSGVSSTSRARRSPRQRRHSCRRRKGREACRDRPSNRPRGSCDRPPWRPP